MKVSRKSEVTPVKINKIKGYLSVARPFSKTKTEKSISPPLKLFKNEVSKGETCNTKSSTLLDLLKSGHKSKPGDTEPSKTLTKKRRRAGELAQTLPEIYNLCKSKASKAISEALDIVGKTPQNLENCQDQQNKDKEQNIQPVLTLNKPLYLKYQDLLEESESEVKDEEVKANELGIPKYLTYTNSGIKSTETAVDANQSLIRNFNALNQVITYCFIQNRLCLFDEIISSVKLISKQEFNIEIFKDIVKNLNIYKLERYSTYRGNNRTNTILISFDFKHNLTNITQCLINFENQFKDNLTKKQSAQLLQTSEINTIFDEYLDSKQSSIQKPITIMKELKDTKAKELSELNQQINQTQLPENSQSSNGNKKLSLMERIKMKQEMRKKLPAKETDDSANKYKCVKLQNICTKIKLLFSSYKKQTMEINQVIQHLISNVQIPISKDSCKECLHEIIDILKEISWIQIIRVQTIEMISLAENVSLNEIYNKIEEHHNKK